MGIEYLRDPRLNKASTDTTHIVGCIFFNLEKNSGNINTNDIAII